MNRAQFNDLVSHMCLPATVVASWFRTQELAGSKLFNKDIYLLSMNSLNSVKHSGKTAIDSLKPQPSWLLSCAERSRIPKLTICIPCTRSARLKLRKVGKGPLSGELYELYENVNIGIFVCENQKNPRLS